MFNLKPGTGSAARHNRTKKAMKNKKWTIGFVVEDGTKYANVIGRDVVKVIAYVCEEYGIEATAINYLSAEECVVVE